MVPNTNPRRIGALLAALALGLPAAGSSAGHPPRTSQIDARAETGSGCAREGYRRHRFDVEVPASSIRVLVLCTDERGVDLAITAHALTAGLTAAADGVEAGREARLTGLASLRSLRARTADDASLAGHERTASLARLDRAIRNIENNVRD